MKSVPETKKTQKAIYDHSVEQEERLYQAENCTSYPPLDKRISGRRINEALEK